LAARRSRSRAISRSPAGEQGWRVSMGMAQREGEQQTAECDVPIQHRTPTPSGDGFIVTCIYRNYHIIHKKELKFLRFLDKGRK